MKIKLAPKKEMSTHSISYRIKPSVAQYWETIRALTDINATQFYIMAMDELCKTVIAMRDKEKAKIKESAAKKDRIYELRQFLQKTLNEENITIALPGGSIDLALELVSLGLMRKGESHRDYSKAIYYHVTEKGKAIAFTDKWVEDAE